MPYYLVQPWWRDARRWSIGTGGSVGIKVGAGWLKGARLGHDNPMGRVCYVGASNGDDAAFYSIFKGAMDVAALADRRMIRASWSSDDRRWLESEELILLAGGDVARGWRVFHESGMGDAIVARYRAGAVLVGTSAGAVQLGQRGWDGSSSDPALIDTFSLVPYLVDVHDEQDGWTRLRSAVQRTGDGCHGLGIPRGGGLVYHADHSLEPLRAPVTQLSVVGAELHETVLLPRGWHS